MVKNSDFVGCKEARKKASFFKVLQGADISSENMRAIPYNIVKSLSETDLARKMKIKADWGRTWKLKISKNPRFYFMEKAGWEKFVRDNFLGDSEVIAFTHEGNMQFTLNILNKDGKEMVQPRQTSPFLASASRVKTENGEGVYEGVKEEIVVSFDLSYLDPGTSARSNGRRKTSRRTKTKVRGSATGFTITIKRRPLTSRVR